jgi:hypothetical protein
MVYYHYGLTQIPETGPGSGEYGPINYMFPLTFAKLIRGTQRNRCLRHEKR